MRGRFILFSLWAPACGGRAGARFQDWFNPPLAGNQWHLHLVDGGGNIHIGGNFHRVALVVTAAHAEAVPAVAQVAGRDVALLLAGAGFNFLPVAGGAAAIAATLEPGDRLRSHHPAGHHPYDPNLGLFRQ